MKTGLGNMPLTLFVIVAGIILFLYIRRANLGIDTHPGEGKSVMVQPNRPAVLIPRSQGGSPPVLPPIPDWVAKQFPVPPQPAPAIQPMPGISGGGVMQ